MGMAWVSFSRSAGCQDSSVEDGGECPPYVVVYVQSYGFVGDVSGIGMLEFGPVLHHPVNISFGRTFRAQRCTDSSTSPLHIRP